MSFRPKPIVGCTRIGGGPISVFVPCTNPQPECPKPQVGPGHGTIHIPGGPQVEINTNYFEKKNRK